MTSSTTLKTTQTLAVTVNPDSSGHPEGTSGNDTLGPVGTTSKGDTLNGLSGNDILDGVLGPTFMKGGLGNDTYFVNDSSDQCIENAGEGTDTVNASASFVLGANIEALVLTGSAAINGTGNVLNNTLTGKHRKQTFSMAAPAPIR